MQTVPHRLVTIIAERAIRDRLLDAVHTLGATGHTISDVQGEGSRGVRAARGGPSVKIEAIVPAAVADRIAAHVAERYFAHHSVIVYLQNVEVLRGSKYAPQNEGA
ncbi:P-II family nitrogen regulator [Rubrivirga sp.]|uniref:P-II family nitrogen regulator n=1 Tax=Rubrivirga sp. TaxID=1885344 RepID=UPI003B51DD90